MPDSIFIGTSGFHYEHWQGRFYPKDLKENLWFLYYAQFFETVELNVSFYRLPSEKAFGTWFSQTPPNFRFSLKGSRYITHVKKLNDVEEPLGIFMRRTDILEDKLAVILWQLPPTFRKDAKKLEIFLKLLTTYHRKNAIEFRELSWFDHETYRLLQKYQVALVMADSPNFPSEMEFTADFLYLRFHGGKLLYGSNYSKKELQPWAEKLFSWQKKYSPIFVYFNNDAFGFAPKNALYLKKLF